MTECRIVTAGGGVVIVSDSRLGDPRVADILDGLARRRVQVVSLSFVPAAPTSAATEVPS
jgi:hypothetical protein